MLCGLLRPEAGEVRLGDRLLETGDPAHRFHNLPTIRLPYALIIPFRIAYLTNSARECRFNLRMIFSR